MIPHDLGVKTCVACGADLHDQDFPRFGVTTAPDFGMVFDFICPRCAHFGRYVVVQPPHLSPAQVLRSLADIIEADDHRDTKSHRPARPRPGACDVRAIRFWRR